MTAKRKKRSRRSEAEQRHRLLERRERLGGPAKPKVTLETAMPREMKVPALAGPAQVATKEYRDGWDRIFGGSPPRGQA